MKSVISGFLLRFQVRDSSLLRGVQGLLRGIVRSVKRIMIDVRGRVHCHLICKKLCSSRIGGCMMRNLRDLLCLVKLSNFYVLLIMKLNARFINCGVASGMRRISRRM